MSEGDSSGSSGKRGRGERGEGKGGVDIGVEEGRWEGEKGWWKREKGGVASPGKKRDALRGIGGKETRKGWGI